MTVTVEPLHCGTLTAARSMFETGADDRSLTIPVPAWLIRHEQGTVLFDCGMHTDLLAAGPVRDTIELFFGVGATADDMIGARLREHDVDPTDVDIVVLSHLHFDHTGGLAQVPDARVVVQAAEWAAGLDDDWAPTNGFRRDEYDLGHDRQVVDGEHDLFGDGAVTCMPTPGHTPGHQSLRVRLSDREIVLCGDCAYFETTLAGGPLPPIGHDHDAQAASIARLNRLGAAGALLVPGHDPAVMARLPARLA